MVRGSGAPSAGARGPERAHGSPSNPDALTPEAAASSRVRPAPRPPDGGKLRAPFVGVHNKATGASCCRSYHRPAGVCEACASRGWASACTGRVPDRRTPSPDAMVPKTFRPATRGRSASERGPVGFDVWSSTLVIPVEAPTRPLRAKTVPCPFSRTRAPLLTSTYDSLVNRLSWCRLVSSEQSL